MENNNLIDNQLERIYLQGYIPRKGKKLFNNIAIIYEMSKKSDATCGINSNRDYVNMDYNIGTIEFSLSNYSIFEKILSFIISNPSAQAIYGINYDSLTIIIQFKNVKKFFKLYRIIDIPII